LGKKKTKKLLLIIYSPHVIQDVHVILSSVEKKKVFDENIPGYFSIYWTSMFKVRNNQFDQRQWKL